MSVILIIMSKILDFLRIPPKKGIKQWVFVAEIIRSQFRNWQQLSIKSILHYPVPTNANIDLLAILLLVAPLSTFALGTWQLQLATLKNNLLAKLKYRTSVASRELPESLEELEKLEYYSVHVSGQYLHDKEMYIGPRTLIQEAVSDDNSIFTTANKTGYLVVTPFKLANKDKVILINRGWVSSSKKNPETRMEGQINDIVEVTGIVRLHENRPAFTPENRPDLNMWFYRDVNQMCTLTGATPIFLDAIDKSNIKYGPIGGQTRIYLKNDHFFYTIQGYSLSVVTSYMWYKQFIRQMRL